MYDLLVKGARIIDGTGASSWMGDIAMKSGRIVAMGQLEGEAVRAIEANGLVASPGFVDIHTHSDLSFMLDPTAQSKIRQGVTLEVTGNCGMSACAPLVTEEAKASLRDRIAEYGSDLNVDWSSFGEWLDSLEKAGSSLNLATLVGHGTVRAAVLGFDDRGPTPDELEVMQRLVAESLDAGAIGLSAGVYFPPGTYARTEELIEIAKVAGDRNKLHTIHIRDEFDYSVGLFGALHEAIEIGRMSGARVEVSHVKCVGPVVWGMADLVLGAMEQARKEGVDVTGDQYPYTASNTPLSSTVFPRAIQAGGRERTLSILADPERRKRVSRYIHESVPNRGGADGMVVSNFPPDKSLEGKSIAQIASEWGVDIAETLIRMYEQGEIFAVVHNMQEDDVDLIAGDPWICVASDGSSLTTEGMLSAGKPHPRNFGCFPRFLARYVRERKVVSLEEGVRKMTSLPAGRLGLTTRGRLAPGYWADIAMFDPDRVQDTATFEKPHAYSLGIPHVIVNGVPVIQDGKPTGETPGKVIREFED